MHPLIQRFVLVIALVSMTGCVAPVLPRREAPASAHAQSWAEGSDAYGVLTYKPPSPRRSAVVNSGPSDVDLLLLAGAAILLAAWLFDGEETHITGQVISLSETPCSECLISAEITNGQQVISVSEGSCNINGYFHLTVEGDRSNFGVSRFSVSEIVDGKTVRRPVLDFSLNGNEYIVVVTP